MLFSSNNFLFFFLPIVLAGYYLMQKRYRNLYLMIMSMGFYAWGEPKFVLIMAVSILFNYISALLIDFAKSVPLRKCLLIVSLIGNLGLLFFYKYLNFAAENLAKLGIPITLQKLALPIGISFFTFQAISYVIEVYRRTVPVQKKLHYLALYISFFPQLVAGPIVRYETIVNQLSDRRETLDDFAEGVHRFIIGLGKKAIISNNIALAADAAFAVPDSERSVAYAWLGIVAYTLQIFFDFSGYSEMAIGLGKMFGFHFLENFDYPYIAKSVSDFWRRWHISLGQWFRDYVYFPLGGSRVKSRSRLIFNLFVVWALTGIWHGASWNFIVWGLFYFVLLVWEKLSGYPEKFKHNVAKAAYRVFTLLAVMAGWVLFRADTLQAALRYGLSLIGLQNNSLSCNNVIMTIREYWLFYLLALLFATPIFRVLKEKISQKPSMNTAVEILSVCVYVFIFVWSISYLILNTYNPFIYFNF